MFSFGSSKIYAAKQDEAEEFDDSEVQGGVFASRNLQSTVSPLPPPSILPPNDAAPAGSALSIGGAPPSQISGFGAPALSPAPVGGFGQPFGAPPSAPYHDPHGRRFGFNYGHKPSYRCADVNVFSLNLGTLASDANLATGDPTLCKGCGAYFNSYSKVDGKREGEKKEKEEGEGEKKEKADDMEIEKWGVEKERGKEEEKVEMKEEDGAEGSVWVCEFCGLSNRVFIEEEERPRDSTIDYILEPPPSNASSSSDGNVSNIVFCIDVSGSMCVTEEVKGRLKLKGAADREKQMRELNPEGDEQILPGWRRDVTWVSRLQCVQTAVDTQIEQLAKEHPNSRVAIVAFSSDVAIVGDGSQSVEVVTGGKLYDPAELKRIGGEYKISKAVAESKEALSAHIWNLEEGGQTALGPALLVSVGLAGQCPGSRVILCTDGLANVGCGRLDDIDLDEEMDKSRSFYQDSAAYAKELGVSVSVVTMKDTHCSMENIGLLARETNGQVDIVHPLDLVTNFGAILAQPLIATNLNVRLIVHRGLFLRYEGDASVTTKDIGNATADTKISFEFGIRHNPAQRVRFADHAPPPSASQFPAPTTMPSESAASAPAPAPAPSLASPTPVPSPSPSPSPSAPFPKAMPFQVQVKFTRLDGSKLVRVVTHMQEATQNREEAERDLNMDSLILNAAQQGARLASTGNYEEARYHTLANKRLLERKTRGDEQSRGMYEAWCSDQEKLDGAIRSEMNKEAFSPSPVASPGYGGDDLAKARSRSRAQNDQVSSVMHQFNSYSRTPGGSGKK